MTTEMGEIVNEVRIVVEMETTKRGVKETFDSPADAVRWLASEGLLDAEDLRAIAEDVSAVPISAAGRDLPRSSDVDHIFTFYATHNVLWAEEIARERGVPVEVISAPPAAQARCTRALETRAPARWSALAGVLAAEGVPFALYVKP